MTHSAKYLKDLESRLQEKLYDNIKLLTHFYPTTKEFNEVFEPSMFAQNNKTAFQHVVYYLFKVLDPNLTKEKITVWPVYDIKLETTFRNQVVAFVTVLNHKYEHANIPNLMASQLISPKGIKFLKFMLKLTILVMFEHLKRDEEGDVILEPIKPHKDTKVVEIVTESLKSKTVIVEQKNAEIYRDFYCELQKSEEDAQRVVEEKKKVYEDLARLNKQLQERKDSLPDIDLQSLNDQIKNLVEKKSLFDKTKGLCETGRDLLAHVCSEKVVLDFKTDSFVVPPSVHHLFGLNQNELNLHQLFHSLSFLLERVSLELPTFTGADLKSMTKSVGDMNEKYSQLDQKLSFYRNELVELSEEVKGKKESPKGL